MDTISAYDLPHSEQHTVSNFLRNGPFYEALDTEELHRQSSVSKIVTLSHSCSLVCVHFLDIC